MPKLKSYLFLLISSISFGAELSLFPFFTFTNYSATLKKQDFSVGTYLHKRDAEHLFKAGLEFRDTSYHDTTLDNYQIDTTLFYENHLCKYIFAHASAHFIVSNLKQANKNQAYLVGLSYKKKDSFDFGIEASYSIYNTNSLAKNVTQYSPYFAFWYGEQGSLLGKIHTIFRYNSIQPSQANIALKSTYSNAEFKIIEYTTNFINIFAYTYGDTLYLVKDQGFTLYNNNEIHKQGILLSSSYRFFPNTRFKISYIYQEFEEYHPTTLQRVSQNAHLNRFILSANINF